MPARDVIRQVIDAANRHDTRAMAERFSKDTVVYDPQYPEPLRGQEAIRTDMDQFIRSFPDVKGELRSVLDDGNTYAFELTMTGTHQGTLSTPSGDIAPTGKRMTLSFGAFGKLDAENRIAEERRYYDLSGLAAQLGIKG